MKSTFAMNALKRLCCDWQKKKNVFGIVERMVRLNNLTRVLLQALAIYARSNKTFRYSLRRTTMDRGIHLRLQLCLNFTDECEKMD